MASSVIQKKSREKVLNFLAPSIEAGDGISWDIPYDDTTPSFIIILDQVFGHSFSVGNFWMINGLLKIRGHLTSDSRAQANVLIKCFYI